MFICALSPEKTGALACLIGNDAARPLVEGPDDFFSGASGFQKLFGPVSIEAALNALPVAPAPDFVFVGANPSILYDDAYRRRISETINDCEARFGEAGWAVATASGVDLDGARRAALYGLDFAEMLSLRSPIAVSSSARDAFVLNWRVLRQESGAARSETESFVNAMIRNGYQRGAVSVFHPRLATAIGGRTLDGALPDVARQGAAGDWTGAAAAVISKATDAVSYSIVIRTIFRRPHLLGRLLVSIARAKGDVDLEVILASDSANAAAEFEAVKADHRLLPLRLALASDGEEPSRNRNLKAGVAAATKDYVWIIDDDDYVDIFAFQTLRRAHFAGARPLIFATCDVHLETWTSRDYGAPVLSASKRQRDYPAKEWRNLFIGYNRIPICGLVAPRQFLQARLSTLPLPYDFSEDYALHIHLLTAPDAPEIVEISDVCCHITQREEGESTMTMEDRTPWVRNITSYIADAAHHSAGPGLLQLLADLTRRANASK